MHFNNISFITLSIFAIAIYFILSIRQIVDSISTNIPVIYIQNSKEKHDNDRMVGDPAVDHDEYEEKREEEGDADVMIVG